MALALTVDSLDSVAEPLRGEYTEKDGKFHLNVEGIEDTTGLKSALTKTRAERDAAAKQAKAWAALGKTPDEIAEMVQKQTELETEAAKKRGDFDGLLAQHRKTFETELSKTAAERDEARNAARAAIVDSSLLGSLAKAKALLDLDGTSEFLTDRLGKRVKLEIVGGKAVHTILMADGETPMAGSGANGLATYDDLVKEAVKKYPTMFEGTGAGGGGKQPNGKDSGGSGDKTITRAELNALPVQDHAAMLKTHKLVD